MNILTTDEGPTLETLDITTYYIGSIPTFS